MKEYIGLFLKYIALFLTTVVLTVYGGAKIMGDSSLSFWEEYDYFPTEMFPKLMLLIFLDIFFGIFLVLAVMNYRGELPKN